jgi:hypothetical protein
MNWLKASAHKQHRPARSCGPKPVGEYATALQLLRRGTTLATALLYLRRKEWTD